MYLSDICSATAVHRPRECDLGDRVLSKSGKGAPRTSIRGDLVTTSLFAARGTSSVFCLRVESVRLYIEQNCLIDSSWIPSAASSVIDAPGSQFYKSSRPTSCSPTQRACLNPERVSEVFTSMELGSKMLIDRLNMCSIPSMFVPLPT